MKLKSLKQLNKEFKSIQDQIHILERKAFIKDTKFKIGRCFKFKNSYSCPETEVDYWWVYKRVLGHHEHANAFISFSFETDIQGNHTTNNQAWDMLSGWIECPEEEYLEAWRDFVININNITA